MTTTVSYVQSYRNLRNKANDFQVGQLFRFGSTWLNVFNHSWKSHAPERITGNIIICQVLFRLRRCFHLNS
ncbi:capsid protein [Trichinella pseudospiralis]